jgi:hypothetical protein
MVRELKKYVGNIGENQHVCIGSQVYFKSHQFLTYLNKDLEDSRFINTRVDCKHILNIIYVSKHKVWRLYYYTIDLFDHSGSSV